MMRFCIPLFCHFRPIKIEQASCFQALVRKFPFSSLGVTNHQKDCLERDFSDSILQAV